MKIIFSRKGFDSASGGVPSPIFPDGNMLSLPIPDRQSPICYDDIKWNEYQLGSIVSQLTKGRIPGAYRAHLDPDLRPESIPRHDDWKPMLGQTGAAQGHLRKYSVDKDDVFLFFGLFREVVQKDGKIAWDRTSLPRHMLWGWLQVGEVIQVDACDKTKYKWAEYHPHFHRTPEKSNTLYIAQKNMTLRGFTAIHHAGAGVFRKYSKAIQLTTPDSSRVTLWELPGWMLPRDSRPPLSYHGNSTKWSRNGSITRLEAVSRGQEFILDCTYYPEAADWLYKLISISNTRQD